MGASEETLALLRSIDDSMKSVDRTLKQLLQQRQAAAPKAIASDRDLDGRYGDPVLKFLPRDWTGPSFKGCKFSECPAPLLDLVAESCEYFARQADEKGERTEKGKPVGDFKRADAARARGWAKRIRDGKVLGAGTPSTQGAGPDDWGSESSGHEDAWS